MIATTTKHTVLYKTEYCRNWTELGQCRYGKKCRYAHGDAELRVVPRHSRYKTQICRAYHVDGACPYGVRCTFIHDFINEAAPSKSHWSKLPIPSPRTESRFFQRGHIRRPSIGSGSVVSSASSMDSSNSSCTSTNSWEELTAATESSFQHLQHAKPQSPPRYCSSLY